MIGGLLSRYLYGMLLGASIVLAGCGSSTVKSTDPPPLGPPTAAGRIKHIVIIMQENRSTDNLFNGFPGADTVQTAMKNGTQVQLQQNSLVQHLSTDLDHSHPGFWQDLDGGKMDGFAHQPKLPNPMLAYSYVPQSEVVPYWTLAQQWTFGDRMFASNSGPSFVAHQYMIAGQSANTDENPPGGQWGCDAPAGTTVSLIGPNGTDLPGIFPCFDYQTIADLLDAKGISWRYYAPSESHGGGFVWSAFQAIRHIRYGSDWTNNVISPPPQIFNDIQNGQLAAVTWVVPDISYSDHDDVNLTGEGPDWVASITNAIGGSQFWDSTAIFISWDDWGGYYDHVVPPQVDEMGLGFRVPLIVVSPYAKRGYVSHVTHEFSGFLKFTEEVYGLPSLNTRDVNADDFADCFDFTQNPHPYTQVPVTYTPQFFLSLKTVGPPDYD